MKGLCGVVIQLFIYFFLMSCTSQLEVLDVKELQQYPSGSGMAAVKNNIFLIGDDARTLNILDRNLTQKDSIKLFEYNGNRIDKEMKADLEGAAIVNNKKENFLMLIGSGSIAPQRNMAVLYSLPARDSTHLHLDTFYKRLTSSGLELNIEGLASTSGKIILANRGNLKNKRNYLVFTERNFWAHQDSVTFSKAILGADKKQAVFTGVSGLDYSSRTDKLYLTMSTEETSSTHEDGAIGKSYLWIVKDISSKFGYEAINANRVIDLEKEDKRFRGFKIESVVVLSDNSAETTLVLVADNDDGKSTLFKLRLRNN